MLGPDQTRLDGCGTMQLLVSTMQICNKLACTRIIAVHMKHMLGIKYNSTICLVIFAMLSLVFMKASSLVEAFLKLTGKAWQWKQVIVRLESLAIQKWP